MYDGPTCKHRFMLHEFLFSTIDMASSSLSFSVGWFAVQCVISYNTK